MNYPQVGNTIKYIFDGPVTKAQKKKLHIVEGIIIKKIFPVGSMSHSKLPKKYGGHGAVYRIYDKDDGAFFEVPLKKSYYKRMDVMEGWKHVAFNEQKHPCGILKQKYALLANKLKQLKTFERSNKMNLNSIENIVTYVKNLEKQAELSRDIDKLQEDLLRFVHMCDTKVYYSRMYNNLNNNLT